MGNMLISGGLKNSSSIKIHNKCPACFPEGPENRNILIDIWAEVSIGVRPVVSAKLQPASPPLDVTPDLPIFQMIGLKKVNYSTHHL